MNMTVITPRPEHKIDENGSNNI